MNKGIIIMILLHSCQHYEAYIHKTELIVHKKGNTKGGKRLLYPESDFWIEQIKTALDKKEASVLCKAILQ
jgi:hypothetical protein